MKCKSSVEEIGDGLGFTREEQENRVKGNLGVFWGFKEVDLEWRR